MSVRGYALHRVCSQLLFLLLQLDQYKGTRDYESLEQYVVMTTAQVDESAQSDAEKIPEHPRSPDPGQVSSAVLNRGRAPHRWGVRHI